MRSRRSDGSVCHRPVSAVLAHVDPFRGNWDDTLTALTLDEIAVCLAARQEHLHPPRTRGRVPCTDADYALRRREHIQKIAWYVRHGFTQALELDVGTASNGFDASNALKDGYRRLASAVYRYRCHGKNVAVPLRIAGDVNYAIALGLWPSPSFRNPPDASAR